MKNKPLNIKDGIPLFTQDRYWGKSSEEIMVRALDVIEKEGWEAFDKQFYKKFDFTYEEDRADWRFTIPITKESRVLDIGAGMGRSAIPMAKIAKEVVAFDQSLLRMKFLKKRAEKEGLDNIKVFVGDIFSLPLEKGSFDVVAMNGVLEWVGKTNQFKKPREAQIAALKICKELLKLGGHLYIGIENRFALAYLKGIDHSGLRFTSYMPRFIANIYTRLRKGESYRTYTYSKRGYKKLLKQAGFSNNKFYLAYPGYNFPRIILPYGNLKIFQYWIRTFLSSSKLSGKLVKFAALLKPLLYIYRFFFFSFNIVSKND